jgi:CRISPR-associated protein Csb2
MTIVLEIEYLLGVSFAAGAQASDVPDWPPQPDRVFSSLVAAWGRSWRAGHGTLRSRVAGSPT